MPKVSLNTIGSRYGSIDALNDNFDAIEAAIENTLSLDGTSPNAMTADLDLNSNDLLNVGTTNTQTLYINGVEVEPNTGVSAGSAFQTYSFTATAGQTTFSVSPATPLVSSLLVSVNGLELPPADVTVSTTNVVIPACTLGDEVVIRRFTKEPTIYPTAATQDFQQAGAGAQIRTVQSKLRDVVSVLDFGAVGDGVTDDTAAIQAALNAGKTVVLPSGYSFKTASSLAPASNQTIVVEDGATVMGNFADYIFKAQGTTSAAISSVPGAISALATSFSMVDASGLSANDIILIYDVVATRGDINVVNYKIGNTVYPFFPIAMSFATPANIRVYKITPVQRAEITGGGTIYNSNAGGGAVSWLYSLDCKVTGVRFNNNAYIACTFQNSIGGVFEGNVVTNNGFSGIGLRQSKGCRIRGNKLFNNRGDEPITLYLSNTHNVVEGNIVVQECQSGAGSGGNAILFDTDNYFNVIHGNTLEGCPTYLIYLFNNSSFNTVVGNVCNRTLLGSIKVQSNSNYNIIDGNVCSNVLEATDPFESGGATYAIRVKSDCSYNYVGTNNFFGLAAGAVLDAQATPRPGYASKFSTNTTTNYQTHTVAGSSGLVTTDFVVGSTGTAVTLNLGATTGNTFGQLNVGTAGDNTVGHLALMRFGGSVGVGRTSSQSGGKLEVDGNIVANLPGSAPTLGVNNDMSFQLVSNTSLKILVRGTDGTTRSTTLTLA